MGSRDAARVVEGKYKKDWRQPNVPPKHFHFWWRQIDMDNKLAPRSQVYFSVFLNWTAYCIFFSPLFSCFSGRMKSDQQGMVERDTPDRWERNNRSVFLSNSKSTCPFTRSCQAFPNLHAFAFVIHWFIIFTIWTPTFNKIGTIGHPGNQIPTCKHIFAEVPAWYLQFQDLLALQIPL